MKARPVDDLRITDDKGKTIFIPEDVFEVRIVVNEVQLQGLYGTSRIIWFCLHQDAVKRTFELQNHQKLLVVVGQRTIMSFPNREFMGSSDCTFPIPDRKFGDGKLLSSVILRMQPEQEETK